MEELGPMIRRGRRHQGLSQQQLADAIGAARSWVSQAENGQIERPDVDRLHRLSATLRLPVDNLLAAAGYHGMHPVPVKPRPLADLIRELYARIGELPGTESSGRRRFLVGAAS